MPDKVLGALELAALVLRALDRLDKSFEGVLVDREEGHKRYGTALGRLHELMLVVLIRTTDYKFTSAQLLEFVRDDMPLALSILGALLRATYEDEVTACGLALLRGMMRADTYVNAHSHDLYAAAGEHGEHALEAFSLRVEAFSSDVALGLAGGPRTTAALWMRKLMTRTTSIAWPMPRWRRRSSMPR